MSSTGDPGLTWRPPAVLDHPAVRAGAWALGAALVLVVVFHFLLPRQVPYGILLLGVVTGSTYSLTAIGLILVYRANRIINFALAEIGVFGAVLFENLIRASGWPWAAALVVGVATAGAAGLVLELGLARRFFNSSRLVLSVATIGMAQLVAFGEYAVTQAFAGQPASAGLHTPLSDVHIQITGVVFDGNTLLLLAALPFVALALGAFLRRTDLGVATRASAENTERAALLGIPVRRLSTLAWVVAALLAGLATVLRSPVVGVVSGSTLQGPTLLLGALTVAVLARFEDIRIAIFAGLAVGAVDQGLYYADRGSTVSNIVFVALIIVTLLLQRRRRDRSDDAEASSWEAIDVVRPLANWQRRLTAVRWGRLAVWAVVVAVVVAVPAVLTPSRVFLASDVVVYAMVAVSLVVVTGWSGQISLGQFGIVAIGAAVAARLSADVGWDFLLALILGGGAGAVVSMVLGAAAFRIKGFLFAVTSLGFAVAVASFFLNARFFPYLLPTHRPERPVLFGQLDLNGELAYFYFSVVVLALLLLAVAVLRRTRAGRVLIAMRDNERAARSYGIGRITTQLTAFALSGFVAGVAGGVLAAHDHAVSASAFAPAASIAVFSMAVIGGVGSLMGAVLGVVLVRGVTLSLTAQWAQLTTGLGLLLVLLVFPGGLGRAVAAARDRLVRRLARGAGPSPPAAADEVSEAPEEPVHRRAVGPAAPGPAILLACDDLDASFGPVQVLFGVDLEVAEGEMLALLGTNGAGKSTLLRTVAGAVGASRGTVRFAGENITGLPPERTSAMGIVTVPGGRGVFPGLSVAENLRVAGWLHRRDPDYVTKSTEEALELFPVLGERLSQTAGTLSGGEQQMLTLAQALMARPTLLMIDELSLGLAPAVVEQLVRTLRVIHARGTTVIVVEQSVNVALTVCDRAVFLERGRVRFDGATTELLERPDLLRAVFLDVPSPSRDAPSASPARPAPAATAVTPDGHDASVPALEGRHLSRSYGGIRAVDDSSISVGQAEILGLIGPNGAGKTTVFDLLSGFSPPDSGQVLIGGTDVTSWSPERRARHGMGRSFQSARLFPTLTVRETVAVASDRHLEVRDPVSSVFALPVARDAEASMWSRVDELLELTGLGAFADALVSELSTGTRRVLDIACGLAQGPRVLLLDEPATGITLHETEQLGPLLRWLRDTTGTALLIVEHELGLVSDVADRLVAMEAGSVVASGRPPDVVGDPRVIASYLGTERQVQATPGSAARALLGGEE
ncbi:MAG TPA: ATP-binding cassette domain-containing protein [Acidimicrobiales bacterium]|nr:ATP-binding cassette domain-containing protein [Acidimicrobiales bacterium]